MRKNHKSDSIIVGGPLPREIAERMRSKTVVNCWHMNEYESAAMWAIYAQQSQGIALQSTFTRLHDSLESATETIVIGMVKYIDWEKDLIPEGNMLMPYLHKRLSFSYEQEIRALSLCLNEPLSNKLTPGKNIPCDIDMLIEYVYISPTAPKWLQKSLTSMINKFGISKTIIQSRLADDPIW